MSRQSTRPTPVGETPSPATSTASIRRVIQVDQQRAALRNEAQKILKVWTAALSRAENFTEKFFALDLIYCADEDAAVEVFRELQRLGRDFQNIKDQIVKLNAEVRPLAEVVVLKPKPRREIEEGRTP